MSTFLSTVVVLCGGAVGSGLRFLVSLWFKQRLWAHAFPWATFVINVTGSFILGAAYVLLYLRVPPERQIWFLLVGTGFCGGYTTFSTFSFETVELALIRKLPWLAATYALGSVVAGFLGAALGWWLATKFGPQNTD